jgi:hypothetical protein
LGGKGRGRKKRGEMTQTLYAHMNKRKKITERIGFLWGPCESNVKARLKL